jgi:MoxR-like ATPase
MVTAAKHDAENSLILWRDAAVAFEKEIAKAIIGQDRVIRLLTVAVFARGHVLLEGDVGVGKTTLLRAVARAIGGDYERIEGTVDLLPSDLIYYTYLGEDGRPRVDPGPVLHFGENLSVLFFNEINRARPQVHSLLLRLMAERSVNGFNRDYNLPFLQVFADRNRI